MMMMMMMIVQAARMMVMMMIKVMIGGTIGVMSRRIRGQPTQ